MGEASQQTASGPGGTQAPFFAGVRAGHVVEVRARRLIYLADVESLNADVVAALHEAGPGAIICADYRRASPLSPRVANAWSRAMRAANRSILMSALLVDPSNTIFNIQIARIVRCAGNDARRIFTRVEELYAWVNGTNSSLTGAEREAVHTVFPEDPDEAPARDAPPASSSFALRAAKPAVLASSGSCTS